MTATSFASSAMQKNHSSAHAGFTEIYATSNPPWDIGRPKEPFIEIADQVTNPVLDAGCGTGDTALFFAARGLQVTGIDFVEEAIQCARIKAARSGLSVKFLVNDAMSLVDWDERFATVIDSGLFTSSTEIAGSVMSKGWSMSLSLEDGYFCSVSPMMKLQLPGEGFLRRNCSRPLLMAGISSL